MATFWRFVSIPLSQGMASLTRLLKQVAMDDPDGIMLRFLRARKWSPSAGVAMLAACIKWRMGE
jgi:uncharacterized protein (DUF58 family)